MGNDLWAIGLTGAAVGGAVGWPLLRRPSAAPAVAGPGVHLLGTMLVLGAAAVAMISVNHSGSTTPATRLTLGHLVYAGDVLFYSLLVVWIRGVVRRPFSPAAARLAVGLPLAGYAAAATATWPTPPPFIVLLPVGAAAATYAAMLWKRADGGTGQDAMVSRIIGLAIALNLAQAVRTFWPDVAAFREIVPLTMTAGFVSIAALAMRSWTAHAGAAASRPPRYAKSAVDDRATSQLLDDLDRGMRDAHWYRDPALTLSALAERLHTRPQVLSHILNQRDGRGFNETIAAWRVADAKRQLEDRASDRFTVDGIAETAGFASRSAFYKAFRAIEGCTPTEYRARFR
jgi:AraC-like DNA-binding protein